MAGVLSLPLCVAASTVTTQSNQSQQTSLQASSANQVQTQQQGQQWGLSDEDWSRYQSLMKGARGIMSPVILSLPWASRQIIHLSAVGWLNCG